MGNMKRQRIGLGRFGSAPSIARILLLLPVITRRDVTGGASKGKGKGAVDELRLYNVGRIAD